jgi:putative amidase-like protein
MHDDSQDGFTRRSMLKVIGGTGFGFWSMAANPAFAGGLQEDSAEAAAVACLRARAEAASTGSTAKLRHVYEAEHGSLWIHERERVRYLAHLGSKWHGRAFAFASLPRVISSESNGHTAAVRLYDVAVIDWEPAPVQRTEQEMRWRAANPAKFGLEEPRRIRVRSALGVPHELTLQRDRQGWRVVTDAYREDLVVGSSPDLASSVWATRTGQRQPNDALVASTEASASGPVEPAVTETATTQYGFDWVSACNYAKNHWSAYNTPTYCNYNSCGGDCANFVSQCWRAGNYVYDGSWYTTSGSCCAGYSSSHLGSTTWVNNQSLRNWVIRVNRGAATTSVNNLGYADIINYDWTGNGVWDHVSIMTDPTNNLVTTHNNDHYNVPWTLGGAAKYEFTNTLIYYNA